MGRPRGLFYGCEEGPTAMFFDPLYLLFVAPAFVLSLWASFRVKSAFNKYSKVRSSTGLTGAQAAERMLAAAGLRGVQVVRSHGFLTDHYNPINKTLALSEATYDSPSVAAIGIACHEAGHALQHAQGYQALKLRSALVPTANIGSTVGYLVMAAGLMFASAKVVVAGAILFSAVLVFQLVTLPVEFDASNRAKALSLQYGLILPQEREGMDRVLNAAALTYVAAAVSTLLTLLYFLMRAGLLGRRDD